MLQQRGDIWAARQERDWVAVTTNSTLRKDHCLVMGKGIAKEAATKYPKLQERLGAAIMSFGLRLEWLEDIRLIAFPVKYNYWQAADINLILRSALQLLEIEPRLNGGRILMPRPGCGNGRLDWAEVEPMLSHYLIDDRFIVFSK